MLTGDYCTRMFQWDKPDGKARDGSLKRVSGESLAMSQRIWIVSLVTASKELNLGEPRYSDGWLRVGVRDEAAKRSFHSVVLRTWPDSVHYSAQSV